MSEKAARESEYNRRAAITALRASVEATEDRDELRVMDSQLRRLLVQIREKMGRRRCAR